MKNRSLKKPLALALLLAAFGAGAAPYDYRVEYVRSARTSCVKTGILPTPGMTFKLDVLFEGDYVDYIRFDGKTQTAAFFGAEDAKDAAGVRDTYLVEFGGAPAHVLTVNACFGRKGGGVFEYGRILDTGEHARGSRMDVTLNGASLLFGAFSLRLDGARRTTGVNSVSIFGMTRDDGSVRAYACYEMRVYGASFFNGGKPVARFIPVVKGGVAGLYDEIGGTFHASATAAPLVAGPKVERKAARKGARKKAGDFSIPVFEDTFDEPRLFAEHWNLLGQRQSGIVMTDGAVRCPADGDGIVWKGDLSDEFAMEAELVNDPAWSGAPSPAGLHYAGFGSDYGNFSVRADGYVTCFYDLPGNFMDRGGHQLLAGYKRGEPFTLRLERRKLGETMMSYAFFVNGVPFKSYTAPAPKKIVGFDGVARWKPLAINGFRCPFEIRRVSLWALPSDKSANLIANSGFEFDDDGVPLNWCNRGAFNVDGMTLADYEGKYLGAFMTDKTEKHSGKQSLRLGLGPFARNVLFFSHGAPSVKGASAVLSAWAKASEPGVELMLRLGERKERVALTTEWARYEIVSTNMPAPGLFGSVWFGAGEGARRTTDAALWLDDVQMEFIEPPADGIDPAKTYASAWRAKADDAVNFAAFKPPATRPRPERKTPLAPAENALNGYALPKDGMILGRYDFYMNEKTADFRVWDGKGGFTEVSLDLARFPAGSTNEVTVEALGRAWKTTVKKLPFRKGATQVNQWSRSLVHDGKPVLMVAPCLISRDNRPRKDGSSLQVDILAAAGFKHLMIQNHLNTADIDASVKIRDYAARKGMKFLVWTGQDDYKDENRRIPDWHRKPTDWTRAKMLDALIDDNVLSYIAADEPEGLEPEAFKAYMAREKRRFPYIPVQMNNSWFGIAGRFAGLPTDVLMVDYYLTNQGRVPGALAEVVSKIDVLRSIAPGKPCWYFVEGENSLHPRLLSYKEQFAQCWGTVAAGASGISWFVNMPTSKCNFDAMKDVNRELLAETAFLSSDELCGGAVVSESRDYLRCLTRKRGDEWRIYVVNLSPHPIAKFAVQLPADMPPDAKVELLYEKCARKAKNGIFGDGIDGYSRRIYRIVK